MFKTLKYAATGLAISVMVAGSASAATYSFSGGSSVAAPTGNSTPFASSNASAAGFVQLIFAGNGGSGWIRNGWSSHLSGFQAAFGSIFGGANLGFFGNGHYVSGGNQVANVSAVPLPATGLLMIGAFGGMAAVRGRKKKAATA